MATEHRSETESEVSDPIKSTEVRRGRLGGSEAAAAAGVSARTTPYELYLQKRGMLDPGEVPDFVKEAGHFGSLIEPILLAEYSRREECIVFRPSFERPNIGYTAWENGEEVRGLGRTAEEYPFEIVDEEHPFMVAHPDAWRLDANGEIVRGVEAKTVSLRLQGKWGEPGTDRIPPDYAMQCHHYAMITERAGFGDVPWDVPRLLGGQTYNLYSIPQSTRIRLRLTQIEVEFWGHVDRGVPPPYRTPPPPDLYDKLYRTEKGRVLPVPPGSGLERLAAEYQRQHLVAAAAGARKAEIAGRLKALMRDAARLEGTDWAVNWKLGNPKVDVDHVAALVEFRNDVVLNATGHDDYEDGDISAVQVLDLLDAAIEKYTTTKEAKRNFKPSLVKLGKRVLSPPDETKELTDGNG